MERIYENGILVYILNLESRNCNSPIVELHLISHPEHRYVSTMLFVEGAEDDPILVSTDTTKKFLKKLREGDFLGVEYILKSTAPDGSTLYSTYYADIKGFKAFARECKHLSKRNLM